MKPILFNTDMVRAILEGRKTVTRRVVKPQPAGDGSKPEPLAKRPGYWNAWGDDYVYRQPHHPGDILYVRETWAAWSPTYGTAPKIIYKADGYSQSQKMRWLPSIHMPREAARIFLRVTDVRVERLQEITEEQAQAEGAKGWMVATDRDWDKNPNHLISFRHLWDSTIRKADRAIYGWEANPWVFVIGFERIDREEA